MSISVNGLQDDLPDESLQGRFSFQHFDQASDFGFENANGERVRKKKKPGRKPNPPTVQERRAQNRAAQRAFREREQQRRGENEKQWKVYNDEINRLKKLLAISQYEVKYLKACYLHLILDSLIHRGSVPHIWNESRIIPSNSHGEYKRPYYAPYGQNIMNEADQTPALLDMMLDKHHIVDFVTAVFKSSQHNDFLKHQKKAMEEKAEISYDDYVQKDLITINKKSQEPKLYFRSGKPQKRLRSPSPEKMMHLPASPSTTSQHSTTSTPPPTMPIENSPTSPLPPPPQASSSYTSSINNEPNETTKEESPNMPPKRVIDVTFEPPPLKTAADLEHMPKLQGYHIIKLQLKLGSILGDLTTAALIPTALQRIVPHDIRIDYVPGASIRDRLILFQEYYEADDLFNFLTNKTVFIGGDVRDNRNWRVGPEYSLKYWFLSHQLMDQRFDDLSLIEKLDVLNSERHKTMKSKLSTSIYQEPEDTSPSPSS